MKKPVRKCGECIHYYACSSWNVGTLLQTDASHCVNYEKSRKKGEWKPIEKGEKGYSAGDFRCSACGQPNKCYCLTDFCPNCGADMRGEQDDES